MSDKLLDLDFSDIEGSVKKNKKSLPKKENKELSGFILTLKKDNKFVFKDMFECTSEEFLDWAKGVYPEVTVGAEEFESISQRIRAFRQIQQFHLGMMTEEQRTTVH